MPDRKILSCIVQLWFHAEAMGRSESDDHFWARPDPDDPVRFIAPAEEQLALVTDDRFHGFAFLFGLMVGGRRR